MAENTNTEREAFEKWVVTEFPSIDLTREGDGYYKSLADEWWTAFQAGRASLSLPAAGQEPVAWPKDAAEVREFVGSHFCSLLYANPVSMEPGDNDLYKLTAHDLLSAFRWWAEGAAPQPAVAAGWMPIETAPKGSPLTPGARLLLFIKGSGVVFGRVYDDGCGGFFANAEGYSGDWEITHWMPLPPAPSTEGA